MPGKSKTFTKKGSKQFDALKEKGFSEKSAAKITSSKKGTRRKAKK